MKRVHLMILCGVIALAVAAAGRFAGADPADSEQSVTIDNFAFQPAELVVLVGTTVTWTNAQSDIPHTSTADGGLWNSEALESGAAFAFRFDEPGEFAYGCLIHPRMRGLVRVVTDPAELPAAETATPTPEATATPAPEPAVTATPEPAPTPPPTPQPAPVLPPTATPAPMPTPYEYPRY